MSDNDETVTLTIQRTCDAKRTEIEMSMSQSLNELKDAITESDVYGSISRPDQRLFHLGRELKNGGRSLSNLGIGRFNNLHLLLLAKKTAGTATTSNTVNNKRAATVKPKRTAPASSSSNNNRDGNNGSNNNHVTGNRQEVIELVDDSDEESDTDVVIISDNPVGSRDPPGTRKRQRTR